MTGAERKVAKAEYDRKYRIKNAARIAARLDADRERMKARDRAKWPMKRVKRLKQMAEWKARNKESRAAYRASLTLEQKAMRATHERNRLARKMGSLEQHTAADVAALYRLQKGKCVYCRVDLGVSYEVDHIIALASGGSNGPKNLQITCRPCNRKKNAKHPIDFAQQMGFLL